MKCSRMGWTITIFVAIILFLPYVFGNYLLINNSPDMVAHTAIIKALVNGTALPQVLYNGQLIVGYPLALIVRLTHIPINTVYLLFNYIVLVLVPIVLYIVIRSLMGQWYALLIAPVALFCSTSILALFQYGIIFSIINMYLILPLATLASIKWVTKQRIVWLLAAILLISLFSIFHPTGLYLRYSLFIVTGILFVWKLRNRSVSIIPAVALICIALVLNWYLTHSNPVSSETTTMPSSTVVSGMIAESQRNSVAVDIQRQSIQPRQFIQQILGIPVFLLTTFIFTKVVLLKGRITLNLQGKMFVCILASFIVVLIGGTLVYSSVEDVSLRLAIDSSIMIAILVSVFLGRMLQYMNRDIKAIHYLVLAGLTIPTIVNWLR